MLPSACLDGVGTPDDIHFRAQYPAYACPCHRSTPSLAADGVWLRVGMVRYTFPVRLFHPLHSSRLLALSKTEYQLATTNPRDLDELAAAAASEPRPARRAPPSNGAKADLSLGAVLAARRSTITPTPGANGSSHAALE